MREMVKTWLWVLALAVLPMGMLAALWRAPLSAGEDDVLYYYPLRVQAGKALARGDWPIVDPLTAGGMAVLGDPQSAVFFPTTWLFAALPARPAYSLSIFAAFITAGVGMWVYLRRLRLARPAAGFGAVAFMLGGFFVAHRVHLSMIQTAAFFPWGLWCFEFLRGNRNPKFFSAFAAMVPVFSLAVLAGHWPMVIQMCLVWAAYFFLRVRPLGRGLLVAALAGVLVVGITAPQWTASFDVMRQATRAKLSYAVAGENSYFPLSAILWLFPFFFGSRWPNIYPQTWWGPWHLCETLGYVGLVTLVLAIVTVWKFRKWKKSTHKLVFYKNSLEGATVLRTPHFALVRTWFWICLGAGVFMLGYYLPTYWLICQLPVLGWVRCPSRMILVVGCGLATLAAVGVDFCMTQPAESVGEFSRCVRRACRRRLPIVMIASLIVLAVLAILAGLIWPDAYPWPMNGSWRDAIQAVLPYNPAVWIPLCLVVLTSVAVWYWLRRPAKNWPMLIALLIVDFSTVAPFVDAPAGGAPGPSDPDVSPAAAWLRDNAPKDEPYRVWGLGNPYGRRQAELLLPRTNVVQEIASISTYGPFQTPAHAGVLGFEIFGTNTDPAGLLNRPDLLAEYNVRYILVEAGGEDEKHVRRARPSAYRLVASLPAVHPGDPAIFIYENQHKAEATASGTAVGFTSPERGPVWWLWWGTLPAGGVYILALAGGIMVRLRTQKSAKPDAKQRVNRI